MRLIPFCSMLVPGMVCHHILCKSMGPTFSARLFLARMRDPRTPQSTRTSPFPDSVLESLLQCGTTFSDVSFSVATKLEIAEATEIPHGG